VLKPSSSKRGERAVAGLVAKGAHDRREEPDTVATGAKVIIIGGGIGGLSTAIALRNAGFEVMVFEQSGHLREIGAGLTIWTNAVKVLQKLGVGDAVLEIGAVIERHEARTAGGKLLGAAPVGDLGRKLGAPSICVHRAELLHMLGSRLDRDVVRLEHRSAGFAQDNTGVTAGFVNGHREQGAAIVGADGLHSVIREQLLAKSRPRYAGYTCWRGIARLETEKLPQGVSREYFGAGRRFGVLNLPKGRIAWYATKNTGEGGGDLEGGRKKELLSLFAGWGEPVEAIIDATEERSFFRNDIYDRDPIDCWGRGRVTLLGDAAHPTTPNYGQGACLAIEDAYVLAGELSTTGDIVGGLRSYESKRVARANHIIMESRRLGAVSQWQNPIACLVRNIAIQLTIGKVGWSKFQEIVGCEP
jgi:2-polyprenyl-6-methoxyphenol hydroxylase-like FAD-dependent oxidoreductase